MTTTHEPPTVTESLVTIPMAAILKGMSVDLLRKELRRRSDLQAMVVQQGPLRMFRTRDLDRIKAMLEQG